MQLTDILRGVLFLMASVIIIKAEVDNAESTLQETREDIHKIHKRNAAMPIYNIRRRRVQRKPRVHYRGPYRKSNGQLKQQYLNSASKSRSQNNIPTPDRIRVTKRANLKSLSPKSMYNNPSNNLANSLIYQAPGVADVSVLPGNRKKFPEPNGNRLSVDADFAALEYIMKELYPTQQAFKSTQNLHIDQPNWRSFRNDPLLEQMNDNSNGNAIYMGRESSYATSPTPYANWKRQNDLILQQKPWRTQQPYLYDDLAVIPLPKHIYNVQTNFAVLNDKKFAPQPTFGDTKVGSLRNHIPKEYYKPENVAYIPDNYNEAIILLD